MFRNHLLYRLIIFDVCATAALVWGIASGFVWPLFETDTSNICWFIVAIGIVGKVSLTMRALKVSRLKNLHRAGHLVHIKPEGFKAKQEHIGDIIQYSVLIGLFGTLVGLRSSVAGIDVTDDHAVMIGAVVQGLFVAINTSIVGIVVGLWLEPERRMVHTATVTLLEDVNG